MQYDYDNISDYLILYHSKQISGSLWVWLVWINIFGLPTALAGSPSILIRLTVLPVVLLMSLFILYVMMDVEKRQKQYVLLVGLFSLVTPLIMIISAFRMYSQNRYLNPNSFLAVSFLIYLIILIVGGRYHIKAIKNGYYQRDSKKKANRLAPILAIAPILGLWIGRIFLKPIQNQNAVVVIIAVLFLLLACLLELGAHNVHKYILIKEFEDRVKIHKLPKKREKRKPIKKQ